MHDVFTEDIQSDFEKKYNNRLELIIMGVSDKANKIAHSTKTR